MSGDEAEDGDEAERCGGEVDSSRAVALGLGRCGILIGWRVEDGEDLRLYAAC